MDMTDPYKDISLILDVDNAPERVYQHTLYKHIVHQGQRKLLLGEVYFLSTYVLKTLDVHVVYVGAAVGSHIPLLLRLFPNIRRIDLYDPMPFDTELIRLKEQNVYNIHIHSCYFTDDIAKGYVTAEPNNIVFISDIRVDAYDEDKVLEDNESQVRWVNIIQPLCTSLKFRCKFIPEGEPDVIVDTIAGEFYLASRTRANSTEVRLLAARGPDGYKMQQVSSLNHERRMAYHNYIRETGCYDPMIEPNIRKFYGICDCFDCIAECKVWHTYMKHYDFTLNNVAQYIGLTSQSLKKSLITSNHGLYPLQPYHDVKHLLTIYKPKGQSILLENVPINEYEVTYDVNHELKLKKPIHFKHTMWLLNNGVYLRRREYDNGTIVCQVKIREQVQNHETITTNQTQKAMFVAQEIEISEEDLIGVIQYTQGLQEIPKTLDMLDRNMQQIDILNPTVVKDVYEQTEHIYNFETSLHVVKRMKKEVYADRPIKYLIEYESGTNDAESLMKYLNQLLGIPANIVKYFNGILLKRTHKNRKHPKVVTLTDHVIRDGILHREPYFAIGPKVDGNPVYVLTNNYYGWCYVYVLKDDGIIYNHGRYKSHRPSALFEGEMVGKRIYIFDCIWTNENERLHEYDLVTRRKAMKRCMVSKAGMFYADFHMLRRDKFISFDEIMYMDDCPTDGIVFTAIKKSYTDLYKGFNIYKWKSQYKCICHKYLNPVMSDVTIYEADERPMPPSITRAGIYVIDLNNDLNDLTVLYKSTYPYETSERVMKLISNGKSVGTLSIDLYVQDGLLYMSSGYGSQMELFVGSADFPYECSANDGFTKYNGYVCEFIYDDSTTRLKFNKVRYGKQSPNYVDVCRNIWKQMVSDTKITDESIYGMDILRCRRLTRKAIASLIDKYTMTNEILELGAGRGANLPAFLRQKTHITMVEPNNINCEALQKKINAYSSLYNHSEGITLDSYEINLITAGCNRTYDKPMDIWCVYIDTYMNPKMYPIIIKNIIMHVGKYSNTSSLNFVISCIPENWSGLGITCMENEDGTVSYLYPDNALVEDTAQYHTNLIMFLKALYELCIFNSNQVIRKQMYDIIKDSNYDMSSLTPKECEYLKFQWFIRLSNIELK